VCNLCKDSEDGETIILVTQRLSNIVVLRVVVHKVYLHSVTFTIGLNNHWFADATTGISNMLIRTENKSYFLIRKWENCYKVYQSFTKTVSKKVQSIGGT